MDAQSAAAVDLEYLHSLPLPPSDKQGLLHLIQACLRGPAQLHSRLIAATTDVSIWRLQEQRHRGLYRVSGLGQVPAEPEVLFELLCNTDLMAEWDVLNKGVRFLSASTDPGGACQVACLHLMYGLPGVPSRLVADRDFVVKAIKVAFPSGMHALFCRSVGQVPGDPLHSTTPRPHVIRGHMWASGFVIVPLGDGSSCLSITLQVDPKGWIPTAVVNLSLEAMPLNIHRIRNLLARLSPAEAARLPIINKLQQQQACNKVPAADLTAFAPYAAAARDDDDGEGCTGESVGSATSSQAGGSSSMEPSAGPSADAGSSHYKHQPWLAPRRCRNGDEDDDDDDDDDWYDA